MKKYNIVCEPVAGYALKGEKICDSCAAARIARNIYEKEKLQIPLKEYVVLVLVNNKCTPIGWHVVSEGGTTSSVIDSKIIGKCICDTMATGCVLVHNHPSGTLEPSSCDKAVTERIKNVACVFDCKLLDHIILSEDGFFSFCEEGLI